MSVIDSIKAAPLTSPGWLVTGAALLSITASWAQAPGVWVPQTQSAEPKVLGKTALSGMKLNLTGFRIEGNVLIDQNGLAAAIQPWLDRELSLSEFEKATQAIARYLQAHGHPGAKVKVARSMMRDGQLAVAIEGLSPRAQDYAQLPAAEPTLKVRGYRFVGATQASQQELEQVVQPWVGRDLKVADLQAPAEAVAQLIRAKGYTLAQAFMPPQKLQDGILEIQVNEGMVDTSDSASGVIVSGQFQRVRAHIIEQVLSPAVRAGKPLMPTELENRLLLANDIPGAQVSVNLAPGLQPGTTQIQARVTDAPLLTTALTLDNHGSLYTGRERAQALLSLNSPTGLGDQIQWLGLTSERMQSNRLSWSWPVGAQGTRAGVSVARAALQLSTQPVPVNLDGRSTSQSLFVNHPWLWTPLRKIQSALSLEKRRLSNALDGNALNERELEVLNLGLTSESTESRSATILFSAGISVGQVSHRYDWGQSLALSKTAGGFGKASFGFQHTQALAAQGAGAKWRWQVQMTGQLSSKNLDTSEKFQLGGPNGIRAYPVGEAFGDQGYLVNLELHRQIQLQALGSGSVFGFADTGGITLSRHPWEAQTASGRPNTYQLHGVGLGVALQPDAQSGVRLIWARKVGHNPNPTALQTDSDGTRSDSRIWLLGTYKF